jgi:glycosyltransferase involved in cell wall biosynthesis
MPACWRALAGRSGVEVHVVHPQLLSAAEPHQFQTSLLLQGVSNEMFRADDPGLDRWLVQAVADKRPDIVVLCGWFFAPYRRLVNAPELAGVRFVLGMDSPWQGTLPQRLTKYRLAGLVKRLDMVIAAGERSCEYARRIGVPEDRVRSGYYGFDYERFSKVARERTSGTGQWPRQFLYLGRYVPQKDLGTLVKAYTAYRNSVSQPWGLTCCGEGVDRALIQGVPGVKDVGFAQPEVLADVFIRHGAFVIASQFEPWGVVIAEAASSGLPVICTTACGAGVDIVRSYFNGLVAAPKDMAGLARAMRWIHEHEAELPLMGRRGQALAEAFSAEAWATRWHNYFLEVTETQAAR